MSVCLFYFHFKCVADFKLLSFLFNCEEKSDKIIHIIGLKANHNQNYPNKTKIESMFELLKVS